MKKKVATLCLIVAMSGGFVFADNGITPSKLSTPETTWLAKVRIAWDHFIRVI
jgi:hypothetical protein